MPDRPILAVARDGESLPAGAAVFDLPLGLGRSNEMSPDAASSATMPLNWINLIVGLAFVVAWLLIGRIMVRPS